MSNLVRPAKKFRWVEAKNHPVGFERRCLIRLRGPLVTAAYPPALMEQFQDVSAVNRLAGEVVPVFMRQRPAEFPFYRLDEWAVGNLHATQFKRCDRCSHRSDGAIGSTRLQTGTRLQFFPRRSNWQARGRSASAVVLRQEIGEVPPRAGRVAARRIEQLSALTHSRPGCFLGTSRGPRRSNARRRSVQRCCRSGPGRFCGTGSFCRRRRRAFDGSMTWAGRSPRSDGYFGTPRLHA